MNNLKAFRCKSCGHLHHAGHAGESPLPTCCVVCSAGVSFTPQGIKTLHPDNWEVLADCASERLKELGLTPEDVARHVPDVAASHAANLESSQQQFAKLLAKKARWQSKAVTEWQKELDAIHKQHDAAPSGEHREAIKAILACEWKAADEELLAVHQACIARAGRPHSGAAKSVLVGISEGSRTADAAGGFKG